MAYYTTSCGYFGGFKGITASELARVKHRGTDYDDIYPEIPSDEELYGISEEEWEEMDEEEREKYEKNGN